jgi:hypothetical protein
MANLPCTRAEDHVDAPLAGGAIDPAPLLGTWWNTDKESPGIVKIVIAAQGDAVSIHAYGAASPEPIDWGEVRGGLYADGVASRRAAAFGALYDFGFLRTHLQAKVNRGVLVVALFNQFTDGSGRASYFNREFYHL